LTAQAPQGGFRVGGAAQNGPPCTALQRPGNGMVTERPPHIVAPKPEWTGIDLHCPACQQEWTDWQPSFVRSQVWVAWCRSIRCPNCSRREGIYIQAVRQPDAA